MNLLVQTAKESIIYNKTDICILLEKENTYNWNMSKHA